MWQREKKRGWTPVGVHLHLLQLLHSDRVKEEETMGREHRKRSPDQAIQPGCESWATTAHCVIKKTRCSGHCYALFSLVL